MSDSRVLIAMDGSENSAMAFKCKYRLRVICNTKSKQSGNSPAKYLWLNVINYMNVFCTFLLRLFQTFCIFNFHTHMHWSLNHVRNVFFKIKITAQWTDPDILNRFFPHRTVYKRDICKFVFKWKDVCVQYHFKIWGRLWMKKDKSSFSRDTVLYK